MSAHHPANIAAFTLTGSLLPLVGLTKSAGAPWTPTRPLGGWLMTYGKIGPDGGVVPTVDRDGHTVEAARELGHIDWDPYVKGGKWNDTHDENIIVGVPETLEFHDGTTPLSKAHGKVGFWTTGHLFDRQDPQSWANLGRTPRADEFDRADHFWGLAHLLKGTPRPIGLSAHGGMALSPCRRRITFARVDAAAVCELPVNPDATLEPLELARRSPLAFLRKGMIGAAPCGACRCAPGSCDGLLRKGGTTTASIAAAVPEDLEGGDDAEAAIRAIMARNNVTRAVATRWLVQHHLRSETPHAA